MAGAQTAIVAAGRGDTLEHVPAIDKPDPAQPSGDFNTVRRLRTFDEVIVQVQDAIASGRFQPGDRLPSERELCQMFGIGRPALREALRVLEVLGVLDIRPGKGGGIFVAAQNGEGVGAALASLIRLAGATAAELGEFRTSFEGETAAWAAQRARPEEVQQLLQRAQAARTVANRPDRRWSDIVKIDIAFHQTVAEASHNRVRVAVMYGLLSAVERVELTITSLAEPHLLQSTANDLQAIAEAISDRDPDRARDAMRAHVEWFSELYVRAASER